MRSVITWILILTLQACGDSGTKPTQIGPSGGTLSVGGAELVVPPGALSQPTSLSLTQTSDAAPAGYALRSPLYRLGPDGLTFATPATIRLPVSGNAAGAQIYLSRAGGGYEALQTTLTGSTASASISHFSAVFVGVPTGGGGGTCVGPGTPTLLLQAPLSQGGHVRITSDGTTYYVNTGYKVIALGASPTAYTTLYDGRNAFDILVTPTEVIFPSLRVRSVGALDVPGLVAVPKGGGAPRTIAEGGPFAIASDGTNLFTLSKTTAYVNVAMVPIAGGTPIRINGTSSTRESLQFAVDSTYVYWGDGNYIRRADKGPTDPPARLTGDADAVKGLQMDATHLYWTTGTGVKRMPIAGGAPSDLATGRNDPAYLVLDADCVYWVERGSGNAADPKYVMAIPKTGGAPVTLAASTGTESFHDLVVDARGVAWTSTSAYQSTELKVRSLPR